MTIVNDISKTMLREFVQYLLNNKYDYTTIIKSDDLKNSLFYYIDFLKVAHNIYITIGDLEILCWTMNGNSHRKLIHFEPATKNILNDYKTAILASFKFIETPF